MSATLEDYDRAIAGFRDDMIGMSDDVVSVLLYGSAARRDIIPGKSDLMDAYVFLRPAVFEDRDRFVSALQTMVDSCRRIASFGIPFHPFHYFSIDEIGWCPALYVPTWNTGNGTKVIAGLDVRSQINCTEVSRTVAEISFFEARRNMGHTLAIYLNKPDWTVQDKQDVVRSLASLKKHILVMAAASLGRHTDSSQAADELAQALPGLDTSVLNEVAALQTESVSASAVELKRVIRKTLIFVETVHDRILARLNNGQDIPPLDAACSTRRNGEVVAQETPVSPTFSARFNDSQ